MSTYYVRADGTATKVNAVGPATDSTKCMSLTTFNASTFAAADTVNFSALGGAYSSGTAIILPSSGSSSAAKITYQGLADGAGGAFPSVVRSGLPVSIPARSYIIFKNFNVANTVGAAGFGVGFSGASATDVTLDYLNISGGGYGVNSTSTAINTLLIDHITCTTAASYFIYLAGNPSSNITIRNSSNISTVGGILIRYAANVTLTGNTVYSLGVVDCMHLRDCAGAVLIKSNNLPSSTGTNNGILLTSSTMTGWIQQNTIGSIAGSGLRTSNSHGPIVVYKNTVDGVNAAGMYFTDGSSDFDVLENLCENAREDGFKTDVGSHDITFKYCVAKNNGNKLTTSDGDGFTSHLTDYNIFIDYCLACGNTASGFAMVGTSSGHVYNCIAYNNGGNWSLEGGGKLDQVRAGFYFPLGGLNPTTGTGWTLKNNIGMGNYPREVLLTDITSGFTVMDNNCYLETVSARFASIDQGASNITWAAYHTTNAQEANSINADPLFVDAANEKFYLRYDSPCIDVGADLGGSYLYGLDRISSWPGDVLLYGQGLLWDMGAYPYRSTYAIDAITGTSGTTIRQQIVTAVAARLATILTANGYQTDLGENVFQFKPEPWTTTEMPGTDLREEVTDDTLSFGLEIHTMKVICRCMVTGAASNEDVRKVHGDITTMVGTDPTWGGLAQNTGLVTARLAEVRQAEELFSGVDVTFDIEYTTGIHDAYA